MEKSKIGNQCENDDDCINENCIDKRCTRNKRSSKKSANKTKKVRFTSNLTREISHLEDDIYFDDLDKNIQKLLISILNYDSDDDIFSKKNDDIMNISLIVDLNLMIQDAKGKGQIITTSFISEKARKILEGYRKLSLRYTKFKKCSEDGTGKSKKCMKMLDERKYAKNIDEFINDNKPLPNKFETILLRQESNVLYIMNKRRSSLLKESVMNDRSEDIITNTRFNSSKKSRSRSRSRNRGGKRKTQRKKI